VLLRGFVPPFRRGSPDNAVQLRLAFEELGGAWIKLGQMLAMRFDLLPVAYCDELFKLLNQVKPFPYDEVREIVVRELGEPPETLFASFEVESFAAASIGQVHRATLPSGERVAVKVQRPNIREIMHADIELMYALSRFVDWTRLFGATKTREVIDEFARWTADELDYLVEAQQAVRMYEHAKGERLEKIARVHRAYTTSRVLTTELIDGVPLIEIMYARREGNDAYLAALEGWGYDVDRVIRNLDWNMLNQVFVFGYFHADLHPANLFVLPGNVIGYVDYGQVGQLPKQVRESLITYTWLLFRGEVDAAIGELMRWFAPSDRTDAVAARRQLHRVHEAFLYSTAWGTPRRPVAAAGRDEPGDNPYSKLAVDIMRVIRTNHLSMSQSIVAYLKMLVTLGTLRHQLAIDYDLSAVVRRYFERMMRRQLVEAVDPRRSIERLYSATVQARRAVDLLEFLEDQEPLIRFGVDSVFGVRRRMRAIRSRLVTLFAGILVVGGTLYFLLADPADSERMVGSDAHTILRTVLPLIIIGLVVALVFHVRQIGDDN